IIDGNKHGKTTSGRGVAQVRNSDYGSDNWIAANSQIHISFVFIQSGLTPSFRTPDKRDGWHRRIAFFLLGQYGLLALWGTPRNETDLCVRGSCAPAVCSL